MAVSQLRLAVSALRISLRVARRLLCSIDLGAARDGVPVVLAFPAATPRGPAPVVAQSTAAGCRSERGRLRDRCGARRVATAECRNRPAYFRSAGDRAGCRDGETRAPGQPAALDRSRAAVFADLRPWHSRDRLRRQAWPDARRGATIGLSSR